MTHQEILDLIEKLDQPFPPEDYKERPLPGGDRWFYVPWQKYRERLDAVCFTAGLLLKFFLSRRSLCGNLHD
ncbi:hypothetical protein [Coleofasciculus sp.]|uniref:hypothetical protein n=1 Tax=Coleofasciculus sp. TaxID=3100458 RepID=UPI0039F7E2A9